MRFEEALKAMREGKKVKFPIRSLPLTICNNKICECGKDGTGGEILWEHDSINTCNIMRDDWEVVND